MCKDYAGPLLNRNSKSLTNSKKEVGVVNALFASVFIVKVSSKFSLPRAMMKQRAKNDQANT